MPDDEDMYLPYNSVRRCPRCHTDRHYARVRYCNEQHMRGLWGCVAVADEQPMPQEHLHVECVNCGYGWTERTAGGDVVRVGGRAIR